jgi:predicted AAA+ superfamily ATPase
VGQALSAGTGTRARATPEFARLLEQFRGVLLVGPRQVGKMALARSFVAPDFPNCFDVEVAVVAAKFYGWGSTP